MPDPLPLRLSSLFTVIFRTGRPSTLCGLPLSASRSFPLSALASRVRSDFTKLSSARELTVPPTDNYYLGESQNAWDMKDTVRSFSGSCQGTCANSVVCRRATSSRASRTATSRRRAGAASSASGTSERFSEQFVLVISPSVRLMNRGSQPLALPPGRSFSPPLHTSSVG